MENAHIPVLGIAAFSGTGKTTLLTKLIPILKKTGLRIGLIKHSHHNFEIDNPEKDSYLLRKAGASPMMIVSTHRRAIITEFNVSKEPVLNEQLACLDQSELDLVLVEGFKAEFFPKIELHRATLNNKLLFPNDSNIIAIASDSKIELTPYNTDLTAAEISKLILPPVLDINDPALIAKFILNNFLEVKQ